MSVQDEVVLPEVPDPDDETESPVPHGDGGVVTEDDRPAPVPGPGQLGEDHADHEGLDDAAEDGLEGHHDHRLGAVGGRLSVAVPWRYWNVEIISIG